MNRSLVCKSFLSLLLPVTTFVEYYIMLNKQSLTNNATFVSLAVKFVFLGVILGITNLRGFTYNDVTLTVISSFL